MADFEHCFEVNFVAVHRFIARRVGAPLADDLAAETFAIAFRRRHRYNPRLGSSQAWLLGIANNLVRQHWRAEQRMLAIYSRLEAEPTKIGPEAGPEAQVAALLLAPRVALALASLPAERARRPLVARLGRPARRGGGSGLGAAGGHGPLTAVARPQCSALAASGVQPRP